MDVLALLSWASRWLHILSMALLVGGAAFTMIALLPAAKTALTAEHHASLRGEIVRRWKMVVHVAITLLIVTGAFNFAVSLNDKVPPVPYHPIFGVKVLLAMVVFFFGIALTSTKPGFEALRQNAGKWLNVQVLLAVVIILLSGVLKMLHQSALTTGSPT